MNTCYCTGRGDNYHSAGAPGCVGMDPEEVQQYEDQIRYLKACHAMQSGVAFEHAKGGRDGEPKHLRVGVNSAHVATAALAALLIEKGVITMTEYTKAQADQMEAEVKAYEDRNPGVKFS